MSRVPKITLQICSRHPGHFPLCFHRGNLYSSRGNSLYEWGDLREPKLIDTLKVSVPRRLLSQSRLLQRLLRLGFSHLSIASSGAMMAIANRILFLSTTTGSSLLPVGRLSSSMRRPMRFGCETSGENDFYISEYFSNPMRGPVRVFRVAGGAPNPVFTFPRGEIRHIHLVQKDPFTGKLWIATGDYGEECRIAWTDDGFKNLNIIGYGDQSWRATCLIFTPEAVLWGMDSPWEHASIIRWDRESGKRDFLSVVDSPVLHGAVNEHGWIALTTSVEPNFKGEKTSKIWASRDGWTFSPVAAFSKDRWSMHLFQFGLLYFPTGKAPKNYVVFSGNAVEACENSMVIGKFE